MPHASILVVLAAILVVANAHYYHVVKDPLIRVVKGKAPAHVNAPAHGFYNDSLFITGWDVLEITTDEHHSDVDQAYAGGYFEGYITQGRTWQHWQNMFGLNSNGTVNPTPIAPQLVTFFTEHIQWLEAQIAANNATSDLWFQVGLQYQFFRGMFDGYNSVAPSAQQFSINMFMMMASQGDLFDLNAALNIQLVDWRKLSKRAFDNWFAENTHCSSLIKLTDDSSNIFFGHASWYTPTNAMRIFKHYHLKYNHPSTASKSISFSSYAGVQSSFDDYYVTDQGLSVIETSVAVFNETMYVGNIKPQLLLYWQRIMVANRMATSGPQWVSIISEYNSGTYNNQWMILDLKLFTPYQDLVPNTLWIAEQFPGVVGTRDVTNILQYGYWPSFNIPSIESLYVQSGYAEAVITQGWEMNDYQRNVRAQIFRRDQGKVTNMSTYQHIMQYNDWQNDPISQSNPLYAIASRQDLDPTQPSCFGAYDAKVSSYEHYMLGRSILAYSGPTPQQPIFSFDTTKAQCGPHEGLPSTYNFDWQDMRPGHHP